MKRTVSMDPILKNRMYAAMISTQYLQHTMLHILLVPCNIKFQ